MPQKQATLFALGVNRKKSESTSSSSSKRNEPTADPEKTLVPAAKKLNLETANQTIFYNYNLRFLERAKFNQKLVKLGFDLSQIRSIFFENDWTLWNEDINAITCLFCDLFTDHETKNRANCRFILEKHNRYRAYDRLSSHEKSEKHKQNKLKYQNKFGDLPTSTSITPTQKNALADAFSASDKQLQELKLFNVKQLEKIINIIKTLLALSAPLRGHQEGICQGLVQGLR